MSFDTWESEFRKSNHKIFRRLYFRRRAIGGAYDAAWVEIPMNKIISFGQITHQFEFTQNIFIKTQPLNIKLNNADGYFNDVDDANSVFYGYQSRYKTQVKIEAGYYDANNAEIGEPIVFVGIILTDIKTELNKITIKADPMIDIMKYFSVKDVSGLYTGVTNVTLTSSDFITHLRSSATDGSGNNHFTPYFSAGAWNPDLTHNELKHADYAFQGIPTAANYGTMVHDLIQDFTNLEDQVFYQAPNGDLTFARRDKLGNFHSSETAPSAPDELFLHTKFEDTVTSEVGPDWAWTEGTGSATASYDAVKHGNGADYTGSAGLTGGSYPWLSVSTEYTAGAFNPDKFTIEFWLKTGYDVSDATAEFAVNHPMYFQYWDEANNYDNIQINAFSFQKLGHLATVASCAITNLSFSAGSAVFLAYVHDKDGIEDGTDTMRIYFAPDGGNLTLASSTATSKCPIHPTSTAKMILLVQDQVVPNTAAPHAIDNLKIYNYAKTDFSDRDTESEYMQPKYFDLVGLHDDGNLRTNLGKKLSIALNVDKVKNWVQIKYLTDDTTASIAEEKETLTVGDSSSSDIYGMRKIGFVNYYFDQSGASEQATKIYNQFKDPKTEIAVDAPFMPFLKPLDRVAFTWQTPESGSKAIDFDKAKYSVIKIMHDLNQSSPTSKLMLREI